MINKTFLCTFFLLSAFTIHGMDSESKPVVSTFSLEDHALLNFQNSFLQLMISVKNEETGTIDLKNILTLNRLRTITGNDFNDTDLFGNKKQTKKFFAALQQSVLQSMQWQSGSQLSLDPTLDLRPLQHFFVKCALQKKPTYQTTELKSPRNYLTPESSTATEELLEQVQQESKKQKLKSENQQQELAAQKLKLDQLKKQFHFTPTQLAGAASATIVTTACLTTVLLLKFR